MRRRHSACSGDAGSLHPVVIASGRNRQKFSWLGHFELGWRQSAAQCRLIVLQAASVLVLDACICFLMCFKGQSTGAMQGAARFHGSYSTYEQSVKFASMPHRLDLA
jgi:hypothetical protein